MADLIALEYIQAGFRDYWPGDTLPAEHPDAAAWVESGAALWRDEDYTPQGRATAKRVGQMAQSRIPSKEAAPLPMPPQTGQRINT